MPGQRLHLAQLPQETYENGLRLKAELDECVEIRSSYRNKLQKFMMQHDIWHIEELDYGWREIYEEYLKGEVKPASYSSYLKAFDRVKRHGMKKQSAISLAGKEQIPFYENQILYLPYHPYEWVAERFYHTVLKKDLVWDFSRPASENMKRQVYRIMHYLIAHIKKTDELRIFLVGLKKLYDVCVQEQIEDIELLELEQIQKYRNSMTGVWEAEGALRILEQCRKVLFMEAPEIHWYAHVWYLERIHLQPERLDPSNPVVRLSFLEVPHQGNRELLKQYMRYGLGLTNLSVSVLRCEMEHIRTFLIEMGQEDRDVLTLTSEEIDRYFRKEQERPVQPATYNKNVLIVQRFFEFLKVRQYIFNIPFRVEWYLKKT